MPSTVPSAEPATSQMRFIGVMALENPDNRSCMVSIFNTPSLGQSYLKYFFKDVPDAEREAERRCDIGLPPLDAVHKEEHRAEKERRADKKAEVVKDRRVGETAVCDIQASAFQRGSVVARRRAFADDSFRLH